MNSLAIAQRFPALAQLLNGQRLESRSDELERLGVAPLWQVEQDLQLLRRRKTVEELARAYRDLLGNPGRFIDAMYEIRVAAMIATLASELELAPPVGNRKPDVSCVIDGSRLFIEVTTSKENFPPRYDLSVYSRATVESSFDVAGRQSDRAIPRSKELRDRLKHEATQLPLGIPGMLVFGAIGGHSIDMEAALYGDEYVGLKREGQPRLGRFENGLFSISDEFGGASSISAVVWIKLVPSFSTIRVHSRLFINARAACNLSATSRQALLRLFDRRAVLIAELERIRQVLVSKYRPERMYLFGSLASDEPDDVHQWSDIDLAIVRPTRLRALDRIREVNDLVEPRAGLNVFVYTPEEFDEARNGSSFVRDEILSKGRPIFP